MKKQFIAIVLIFTMLSQLCPVSFADTAELPPVPTVGRIIHEENFSIARLGIDGSEVTYQYDEHWEMYTYFKHNELIDNIYDCLISLKADKRI